MRTNFQMEYENITMTRGDTLSFNVEVYDQNEDPITADTVFFTCKKRLVHDDNIFQKSLGAGITQDDGLITVRVAPEDTAEVEAGLYFYDCQIGVDSDIYTVMKGILTIEQDVTF